MGRLDEIASEQFARWVERGQGWKVWPGPVSPEPPFRPFMGFRLPCLDVEDDDGRKPNLLASFFESVERSLNPKPPVIPECEEIEPEAEPLLRDPLIEFQASLPDKLDIQKEAFEQFLLSLSLCREPIAFELIGTHKRVTAQFAAAADDALLLRRQLQA